MFKIIFIIELFLLFFFSSKWYLHSNIYKSYVKKTHSQLFLSLKEENKKLLEEISKLRNKVFSYKKKKYYENEDIFYLQKYKYIPVKIIYNSIKKKENYFIINKGKKDGICENMGIILPNGVAGIIIKTSPNFGLAISLLNVNIKINARIKRNKYFGSISWKGKNPKIVSLTEIPRYVSIKKGDIIETGGKSLLFPEGIPIGIVKKFKFNQKNGNSNIIIKLFENFSKLENAYVVKNILKKEIIYLKKK